MGVGVDVLVRLVAAHPNVLSDHLALNLNCNSLGLLTRGEKRKFGALALVLPLIKVSPDVVGLLLALLHEIVVGLARRKFRVDG